MWFVLLEMLVEVVSKTPYNFYKNAIIFFLLNEIFFVENFIDEYLFYDRSLGRKLHWQDTMILVSLAVAEDGG